MTNDYVPYQERFDSNFTSQVNEWIGIVLTLESYGSNIAGKYRTESRRTRVILSADNVHSYPQSTLDEICKLQGMKPACKRDADATLGACTYSWVSLNETIKVLYGSNEKMCILE